jgi:hypothetical protein
MTRFDLSLRRLFLFAGYGTVILSMLACAALSGGGGMQNSAVQLADNVVKVKLDTGEWMPVAGESTFSLVGKLESTNPWTVAGKALSTNSSTKMDDGLQVGDLVHVQGTMLDANNWLAYSIERAQEQTDPTSTVVLIGKVDSVSPWVVNGTQLNVTSDTNIEGDIKPGTIVRVAIQLLNDGTWKVLSISPLGQQSEASGCATVVATVASVNGDEIQFLGWPNAVTFSPQVQNISTNDNSTNTSSNDNEDENENENGNNDITSIGPGDTVSAVVCVSKDGQPVITHITMLDKNEESDTNGGTKVLICHKPGKNQKTLSLPQEAVPAHLGHGDKLGACP